MDGVVAEEHRIRLSVGGAEITFTPEVGERLVAELVEAIPQAKAHDLEQQLVGIQEAHQQRIDASWAAVTAHKTEQIAELDALIEAKAAQAAALVTEPVPEG